MLLAAIKDLDVYFRSVLPVCIKTANVKYRLFKRVEVIFGELMDSDALGFVNGGNDEYTVATEKIFSAIVHLGGYDREPAENAGDSK